MDENVATAYLALRHSDKISALNFARQIREHGSIASMLAAPGNEELAEYVARPDSATRQLAEEERQWAEHEAQHLLFYESPGYPSLLREIDAPPPVLAVRGRADLNATQVALVGSRNCSAYGKRISYWLAKELAALGMVVTSGLARGIDTASHLGALHRDRDHEGRTRTATNAVVAHGLDFVYPRSNTELAKRIAEQGSLVSEFPLGSPPLAGHFPRRNRIISGLSCGVVIVEAAMKSGSLITARLAMEQNREVFAVPGPINSAASAGCHWLIKNGASLVEEPGDILTELNDATLALLASKSLSVPVGNEHARISDPQCVKLLNLLQGQSLLFDELRVLSELPTEQLIAALLQLEIEGCIEINADRITPIN